MGTFFGVLDGREWRVEQAGSQWWLYDRENWAAVVIQREGKRYVVIKPHCIPEQSAPTLEAAFGLAKQLAMWALPPDPDTDRRFRTVNHWDRIQRETAWGRPKSVAESARDFPAQSKPAADTSLVSSISADLELPTFLRLPKTGGEMRQPADQSPLARQTGDTQHD